MSKFQKIADHNKKVKHIEIYYKGLGGVYYAGWAFIDREGTDGREE